MDIAVVKDGSMYPVEVKWTKRIRAEDIKEIQGYSNGIILTPWSERKTINSIPLIPLVRFLIHTSVNQMII